MHSPDAGGDGVALSYDDAGDGQPIVALHGLTATRRYVVMGSRALERSGHRVIAYDARGHGKSSPAPTADAYGYEALAADLETLLDSLGIDRALLAGASMGAQTALAFALTRPERVDALALITPAFDPDYTLAGERLERYDALAAGLRDGGVEGFVEAYRQSPAGVSAVDPRWRPAVLDAVRQRMALHEHPGAVADALRVVPRSRPFTAWEDLRALESIPAVVVASRDEADPEHPLALGQRYAEALGGAAVRTEEIGSSPLAWQGGQLSRVIAELAARSQLDSEGPLVS
ncbi:MAG TPA: alpha/beta hydrolase [Solirubrobacteraceae bacterium]|nr:alpha/beta hydrolase [Solirubrobacteraceae bacterium]